MKKILFFCTVILSGYFSKAQLAPVNTEWYFGSAWESPPWVETSFMYRCEKDTLINGKTFSAIQEYLKLKAAERVYMRKDSGKVFYFFEGKEYLYFDFTAKKGDTLYLDILKSTSQTSYQVLAKTPVLIANIFYEKNNKQGSTDSVKSFSIAGFLSSWQVSNTVSEMLLNNHVDYSFISLQRSPSMATYNYLRCYMDEFYIFHSDSRFNSQRTCNFESVGMDEMIENDFLKIYPNPGREKLFFKIPQQLRINTIEIFDITGKAIKSVLPTALNEVEIADLPEGIYFIKVFASDKIFVRKFVKTGV